MPSQAYTFHGFTISLDFDIFNGIIVVWKCSNLKALKGRRRLRDGNQKYKMKSDGSSLQFLVTPVM